MWEAAEQDGRMRHVRDPETGATMRLRGTPEIDTDFVDVQCPDGKKLSFSIRYTPENDAGAKPGAPVRTVELLISSFRFVVKDRPGTFDGNTRLVRDLIEGLALLVRKWPKIKTVGFYSDLESYKKKGIAIVEFDFPSDEELACL
ncbi:MAG: hypothetical protein AB1490_11035 [Pseudomonadota bacterium]